MSRAGGAFALGLLLAASTGCGRSAFDDREARAWSHSVGPPDGISSAAWGVAISTVDREQPGATIVIAGSDPASLSTLSFDVGGELEQHGVDTASAFPAAPVLAGALDPVAGGKGVIAVADGAGGIRFYDARTGDVGPELRATIGSDACATSGSLGGALLFALTDPDDDIQPDLAALAGAELAVFRDIDLAAIDLDPGCTRCALSGEGVSLGAGTVDDDDGEDIAVLAAAGDEIAVFTAAQVRAQDGQGCGTPLLAITPPEPGERFAPPLGIGDIEDNEAPEIAVASADGRALFVFHDVAAGSDAPPVIRLPAPADSASFGAAIAFGDFDGDEVEELAVGDPDASPEGVAGAGQVTLYRYDGEELKPAATLYDSEPQEGQHFGRSLVVAEFGLGGAEYRDLLVVGAEDEVFTYFRATADTEDPRN